MTGLLSSFFKEFSFNINGRDCFLGATKAFRANPHDLHGIKM